MDDRFTMANMAIEAGAKNGIFPVDDKTRAYLDGRVTRPWEAVEPDADAEYEREVVIDLDTLQPTVALPHLPSNTRTVDQVEGTHIDQVVIGSCTNGRLEDLRQAAAVLKGRKVAAGVRCIVIPATQQITLDAMAEGLIQTFIEAGCAVSTPPAACLAATWACSPTGSGPSPPPTATSWAAWALSAPRSSWPTRGGRRVRRGGLCGGSPQALMEV